MHAIPESRRDLVQDETGARAHRATLMSDGSPHLTPPWFNTDVEFILINSALGRIRDRNMRARTRAPILIVDPNNPFHRHLEVRRQVVEVTEHGDLEHINPLSLRYDGKQWNPVQGHTRLIYRILPEKAFADG